MFSVLGELISAGTCLALRMWSSSRKPTNSSLAHPLTPPSPFGNERHLLEINLMLLRCSNFIEMLVSLPPELLAFQVDLVALSLTNGLCFT